LLWRFNIPPNRKKTHFKCKRVKKKLPKVLKERNEILFWFNPYENGFITRNEMGGGGGK
jgi:hypothetical protein